MKLIGVRCEWCGEAFETRKRRNVRRFCSSKCRGADWQKKNHRAWKADRPDPRAEIELEIGRCRRCLEFVYIDECYVVNAFGLRHMRCSHGPAPRPAWMPRPEDIRSARADYWEASFHDLMSLKPERRQHETPTRTV